MLKGQIEQLVISQDCRAAPNQIQPQPVGMHKPQEEVSVAIAGQGMLQPAVGIDLLHILQVMWLVTADGHARRIQGNSMKSQWFYEEVLVSNLLCFFKACCGVVNILILSF